MNQKNFNRRLVWGLSPTFNNNSNLPFKEKPSSLAPLVRMGLSFIHNSIIRSLQGGLSLTTLTACRTSAGIWSQLVSHLLWIQSHVSHFSNRLQVPRLSRVRWIQQTMTKCLRCPRRRREAVNTENNRDVTVFSRAEMKADRCPAGGCFWMGGTDRGSLNCLERSRGSVSCQEKVQLSFSLQANGPQASSGHLAQGFSLPSPALSNTSVPPAGPRSHLHVLLVREHPGQGRCALIGPPESHARLRTNDWSVRKRTRLPINQSRRPLEQGGGVIFPQSVGCVEVGHTSLKEILA